MNKQTQKAGSNSHQVQAGTINIGVDEKRVREIFHEKITAAIKDLSSEAATIAEKRVEKLENILIPKIIEIENGLNSFADPSFQLSLIEAQKSAAGTERSVDYELLSELLIHRIQKGESRETRVGIKKAIEIVGDISDEALLGLTVVNSVGRVSPTIGNITDGLNMLDYFFGEIMYDSLPTGTDWFDHLDILDTIRINFQSKFPDVISLYSNIGLRGYVDVGFKANSKPHQEALELLRINNLPSFGTFVTHSLNPDYIRLNITNIDSLDDLSDTIINNNNEFRVYNKLTQEHKDVVKAVYNLYDNDKEVRMENFNAFKREWEARPNLKKLKDWCDNLPYFLDITSVGKVLAYSNAQRCVPVLPPFK